MVSTPFLTDTSDTVLTGIEANWGNCRNWSRRSESLVTRSNTGYYRVSASFTVTCKKWAGKNPFFGTRIFIPIISNSLSPAISRSAAVAR